MVINSVFELHRLLARHDGIKKILFGSGMVWGTNLRIGVEQIDPRTNVDQLN